MILDQLIWIPVLVISLFSLIQGSKYFTESAEKMGISLGMPSFVVGVTIVAVGTSLPELISSVLAVVNGASEIVAGNVIGSNITNIFLVLGITAVVAKRIKISRELLSVDLTFLVGSSFLLVIATLNGVFTLPEALLYIAGFFVYISYALTLEKEGRYGRMIETVQKKEMDKNIIVGLAISPVFIYLGAFFTIESVVRISEVFDIGTEIIAASVIALGTSLPELAVSISAVSRGKAEMAIGNILGSNIFNTFAVMGISGLFGTLVIPNSMITLGLPMLIIATFLYFFSVRDNVTTKWEGWILIIFYIFFIAQLFNL